MTQSSLELVRDTLPARRDNDGRRQRLRDFQAQLVDRMQAARSGADVRVNQLGVMIGQTRWLLNLKQAGEIVSVGMITKVPLTQEWFLGLSNIRGNLISIVDFARFQGQHPVSIEKESRIVVFAPALGFNSGLLVSRVMGLRNIAEMELHASAGDGTTPWSVQRYVDHEHHVWNALDLSLVVQDPQFLYVGL